MIAFDKRQFGQCDGIGDRNIGARTGIEIKRHGQLGFASDLLVISDQIGLCRRPGEWTQRRQQLNGLCPLSFSAKCAMSMDVM